MREVFLCGLCEKSTHDFKILHFRNFHHHHHHHHQSQHLIVLGVILVVFRAFLFIAENRKRERDLLEPRFRLLEFRGFVFRVVLFVRMPLHGLRFVRFGYLFRTSGLSTVKELIKFGVLDDSPISSSLSLSSSSFKSTSEP